MSEAVNFRLTQRFEYLEPGPFKIKRRIEKGTVVGPDILDEKKQGFVISRDILTATTDPIGLPPFEPQPEETAALTLDGDKTSSPVAKKAK